MIISATIADNGTGPVALVVNGTDGRGTGQGTSSTDLTAVNTFTGGTFVNAGRLVLSATGVNGTTTTAIGSGNLTISGGFSTNGASAMEVTSVAHLATAGQIANTATVTLNGGAILDLAGNTQVVGGLVFNNTGGFGPSVSFAGGTLVLGGNVTAAGNNLGAVATLGGTIRSGRANGSTTTLLVSSTAGLAAGMTVSGGNINATTISSITDANTIVIASATGNTGASSLISFGSSGTVSLGGATRTFAIDDVKWNGAVLNPYLAQLNVTAVVTGTGSEGLTKTGNGLLQLSAQNTFTGGVTVSSGGLIIGASTNVTTRDAATAEPAAFVSGPVGTGTLTMAGGTRLLASTASTINNAYAIGTTLTFAGTNALTLNAPTTLVGNTTITVDEPMVTLTLNGIIGEAGSGYSLTKQGLGTLLLGGNNTFTGGVTVNAGTLALAGLNAGSTAPIYAGTTATIGNNGMLALLNSGTGSNGIISYAGKIAVSGSLSFANISVGNNGANTGNTVQLDELLLNGGQTLNVTSANSYVLRILNLTGDTADGTAPQLNVASGSTAVVFSYTGDKPVNVGLGSLVFPDLVYAATSTTLAANPVVLSGSYPMSVQNSVIPLATDISTFGHAAGGLSANLTMLASAPSAAVASGGAGVGYSASGVLTTRLADGVFGTRPGVVPGTGANTLATYSGLLKITTAGSYVFRSGTDDGGTLFIDGSGVLSDGTFGHAFTDIPAVTIPLTAGYHFISYKFANSGSGGGYRLLYSGADTTGFQTVGGSNVFAATGAPTAANLYNGAAIVNNDYSVAASTTATIDTFGSVFGVVIDASKAFTLGNNAVLNVLNGTNGSFGNGYFGSAAPTSIGTGVILATTNTATAGAGSLNLIGAVTQSGATLTTGVGATTALIKAGQGTLSLGADNSATFSGLLVVQGGTVVLNNAKALSTGTTGTLIANNGTATAITGTTAVGSASITASTTTTLQPGMAVTGTGIPTGAYIVSVDSATAFTLSQAATAAGTGVSLTPATSGMLDLNGLTGVTGNVTINGAGSSLLSSSASAALWNSSATAASLTGALTLGGLGASVGGYGDLTLSVITSAASSTLTKTGTNTLFLNTDNATTLQGPITISAGIVKLGHVGALGAASANAWHVTTLASGAILDLNGLTVSEYLTISGTGWSNFSTSANSLAALTNSSSTAATVSSPLALGAASSIGSGYVNAVTGGTAGGDITLSGAISGAFLLTKVGSNTLTLTGANAQSGLTITQGAVVISGASGAAGSGGNVSVNSSGFNGLVPLNLLTLDNSTAAYASRLGGAAANRSVLLQGAGLTIKGHATTAVNEAIGTGTIQVNSGFGVLTLVGAGANVQLSGTSATFFNRGSPGAGTLLLRGTHLGLNDTDTATAAPGATNTSVVSSAAQTNFVGSATATNGDSAFRVIPWIVIDPSATGTGTSASAQFGTYDATAATGFRPLIASSETTTAFTAGKNLRLTGALTVGAAATTMTATSVNSLTFESGGGLTIADYRTLTNASGGILAKTSATIATTGSGIGKGALFGNSNTEAVVFVFGSANTLTIEAPVGGALAPSTGGLTLSGNGKLVLASTTGNNYGGTTTVHLGTLQLGASAPDNALSFKFATSSGIGGSASSISLNALVSNGGIFDLNGHSQSTLLLSRGTLPGSGGVITNTATGSAVNLTHVQDGNNREFAGQLNGNLNLRATGLGTTTLRDNNQFTGNATIMGAPVILADQGRFSGMGSGDTISIRNSILRWDDTGLQSLANRISTDVAIELDGGTFEFLSRGAAASTISLGNLSLVGGTSTLRGTAGSAGFGNGTLALTGTFSRAIGATLNITSGAGVVGASPYFTATAAGLTISSSPPTTQLSASVRSTASSRPPRLRLPALPATCASPARRPSPRAAHRSTR